MHVKQFFFFVSEKKNLDFVFFCFFNVFLFIYFLNEDHRPDPNSAWRETAALQPGDRQGRRQGDEAGDGV